MVVKKKNMKIVFLLPTERNQNIPPPPGSNPPAPSNTPEFKPPPLQAEVKPPPKRRKSNSNPTGTCKVKQEKCDSPLSATSSSSSGKLSKSKLTFDLKGHKQRFVSFVCMFQIQIVHTSKYKVCTYFKQI